MAKALAIGVVVFLLGVLVVIAGPPWEGPLQAWTAHAVQTDPQSWNGAERTLREQAVYGPQVTIGITKSVVWLFGFLVVVWMAWGNRRKKGKTPR